MQCMLMNKVTIVTVTKMFASGVVLSTLRFNVHSFVNLMSLVKVSANQVLEDTIMNVTDVNYMLCAKEI